MSAKHRDKSKKSGTQWVKVVLFKNVNINIGTECLHIYKQQVFTAGIKDLHNETVLFAHFHIGIIQ